MEKWNKENPGAQSPVFQDGVAWIILFRLPGKHERKGVPRCYLGILDHRAESPARHLAVKLEIPQDRILRRPDLPIWGCPECHRNWEESQMPLVRQPGLPPCLMPPCTGRLTVVGNLELQMENQSVLAGPAKLIVP